MIALHHVQVACPAGGEAAARRFYAEGLGLTEADKPAALVGRGGVWFRSYDERGTVRAEVHVGVEDQFTAAGKAHPTTSTTSTTSTPWRRRSWRWAATSTGVSGTPSTGTGAFTSLTRTGTGWRCCSRSRTDSRPIAGSATLGP
jgi:catechol 2,3-dioxygenase-like lactoylglutathione lyase family enzyme